MNDIQLVIPSFDYAKIMHWVNKSTYEVSGFGKLEETDGIFYVTSTVLLEQENSMADTEIDAKALSKAMFELRDKPGKFKFWWHSHVDMPVFWSKTDLDAIHSIGGNGWVLATVFNKAKEHKTMYYQKKTDSHPAIRIDDIVTHIDEPTYNEEESWDKEYSAKVKNKTFQSASVPGIASYMRGYDAIKWNDSDDVDDEKALYDYFGKGDTPNYGKKVHHVEQKFITPPIFKKIKNKKCLQRKKKD